MASPQVSTPSSTYSSSMMNLAPAPSTPIASANVKMLSIAPLAAPPHPQPITTTKEWVIPPRPKPGRKPATDTPPTKRKAQNRAAQRAFRERRAARVGELEEQLEESRDEQRRREKALHDRMTFLEAEISRLNDDLEAWKLRCDTLDRIADYERKQREAAITELSYLRHGSSTTSTDAVSLPPRKNARQSKVQYHQPHHQQQMQAKAAESFPSPEDMDRYPTHQDGQDIVMGCGNCKSTGPCACLDTVMNTGCGKCSSTTRCQCLDETMNILASTESHQAVPETRRPSPPPVESMEIDFTAQFSKPLFAASQASAARAITTTASHHDSIMTTSSSTHSQRHIADPCGFCEEGTYCVCADAAAAAAASRSNNNSSVNRLAPILNEVTPPPSDADAPAENTHLKLPSINQIQMRKTPSATVAPIEGGSGGCGSGGPGTCLQCQKDPMSGLFCRSLAALRKASNNSNNGSQQGSRKSSPAEGGCCGGSAGGGGCCRMQQQPQKQSTSSSNTSTVISTPMDADAPPSLSCADAYKTLSTHKNFEQASDELNVWLGKLQATPAQHEGRAPMEVEAASVMGVLKLFDRRFGRG